MASNDDSSNGAAGAAIANADPPEGQAEGGEGGGRGAEERRVNEEHESVVRRHRLADGFRNAVNVLEDRIDRRPIQILDLSVVGTPESIRDDVRFLPRFVTLLGMAGQEGDGEGGSVVTVRTVREIVLSIDYQELMEDDMERLFRDVLPNHRTLQRIKIQLHGIPVTLLEMLTRSVPSSSARTNSPLSSLAFSGAAPEQVQAIVDMLKRNVAIEKLEFLSSNANHSKRILQALPSNTNLRDVSLTAPQVYADTLDGVGAASSLRRLHVLGVSVAPEAVSSLTKQLRTNEALEYLCLQSGYFGGHDPQPLLELAKTYNWTLRLDNRIESLYSGAQWELVQEQLEMYARRNARIRDAFAQLHHPDPALRRNVSKRLLPLMLGLMSDLPTVLYRIMKLGYVNKVSSLLAGVEVDDGSSDVGAIETAEPDTRCSTGPSAKRPRNCKGK